MFPVLLAACAAEAPPADGDAVSTVVSLETADGLTLEADAYPGPQGGPGVVLLHMNPVHYDRTGWPQSFAESLVADGWTVLVPDRRGAGGSEGEPEAAYGPDGVYDVRAAVDWLRDEGAPEIALVAASNGSTSALDYAVTASEAGYPAPIAQAWLSPGDYTETNHTMSELSQARLFLGYPPEEAGWPEDQRSLDPGTWTFRVYDGGEHGTLLFASNPEVADDLRAFLGG